MKGQRMGAIMGRKARGGEQGRRTAAVAPVIAIGATIDLSGPREDRSAIKYIVHRD